MADNKEFKDIRWVRIHGDVNHGYIRKSAVVMMTQETPEVIGLSLENGQAHCIRGDVDEFMDKHFKESFKDLQADTEPLLDDIA